MSDPALWIALAACLSACCYFAACNLALKSFSRAKLSDLLEAKGWGQRAGRFSAKVPKLLLMTGVLRTFFSLMVLLAMLGMVRQRVPHEWNPVIGDVVAFLLAGALVSIFGVAVPLSWSGYHPEKILAWSVRPLQGCLLLFTPLVQLLHLFDPIVRRITGGQKKTPSEDPLTDELMSVVQEHEEDGDVDQVQKQMIEALVELPSTTADQIMTPRTEVQGFEIHASLDEIRSAILQAGHSRIPVYEKNIDNIVGILYAKDMIRFLGTDEPFELRKLLREVMMVPPTKPISELLAEFKSRKVHIAIVLDEYGGTAGLVTIEDVLEEIVGDIQDEYELTEQSPNVRQIDDYTAEVDARVYVDDLNDAMDLSLPEDADYDTVGGFVFSTLGHIPQSGEQFEYHGLSITVTEAQRTRVLRVRIQKPPQANGTDDSPQATGDHSD